MQKNHSENGPAPQRPSGSGVDRAIDFLRAFDESGRHALFAIYPDENRREGRVFGPGEWLDMAEWIAARDGRANLYFSPNEPAPDAPHDKLSKGDIARVRAVFADLDPAKGKDVAAEQRRLSALVDRLDADARPTFVVESGSGLHLHWRLAEALPAGEAATRAEDLGRGIAHVLGGDRVQNVDRIMRLPGTLNLPDVAKRARGREKRRAAHVGGTGELFTLDALEAHFPPRRAGEDDRDHSAEIAAARAELDMSEAEGVGSLADLAPDVRERFRAARRADERLERLWRTGEHDGEDRTGSGRDFAFAAALRRCGGFTITDLACLLFAWEHSSDEEKLVPRHIARTWVHTARFDLVARFITPIDESAIEADLANDDDDDPVLAAMRKQAERDSRDWPEAVDIFGDEDLGDIGGLPPDALPSVLGAWVRSEARRKGVPEIFAAAAAVATAGAAIGTSLRIQPRRHDDGFTQPGALWVALVADPGSAKSPMISAAVEPLRRLDAELARQDGAAHARWEQRKKATKGKADPGPEPIIRRRVVDDATVEKQIAIHAANPRGILRAPDELFGFLDAFGAYKRNGGADRSQMLRFFDGRDVTVDRVGTGTMRAESALMGVIAGTQPSKIRDATANLEIDGMLQRFLFILDDGRRRRGVDEAPDRAAITAYHAAIRALATATPVGAPIRLSTEATAAFTAFKSELEKLMDLPGLADAGKGHLAKWEMIAARIILVFHALEQIDGVFGCVVEGVEIAGETAVRAITFARVVLQHSMRFYCEFVGASPAESDARWIAGHILTKPEEAKITRRDITRAGQRLKDSDPRRITRAMAELEAAGWVRCEGTRPGNEPTTWAVNPAVHERFKAHAERENKERRDRHARIIAAGEARRELFSSDKVSGIEI